MFQLESEMVRVEGGRSGDIGYLIAHAMDAENAMWLSALAFVSHCRCSSLCLAHHKFLRLLEAVSPASFPISAGRAVRHQRRGYKARVKTRRFHRSDRKQNRIGKN
jgi:hypothetical protein